MISKITLTELLVEIEYQERLLDGLYFSVQGVEKHLAYLKELKAKHFGN